MLAKVYLNEVNTVLDTECTILRLHNETDDLTILIAPTLTQLPEGGELYDVQTAFLYEEKSRGRTVFGRLVAGDYFPEKLSEAVQVSHAILPLVREQVGFVGVYLFTKSTGQNFSISIWEQEENSNFNIESGWWLEQVRKFDTIYQGPPTKEEYSISIERG